MAWGGHVRPRRPDRSRHALRAYARQAVFRGCFTQEMLRCSATPYRHTTPRIHGLAPQARLSEGSDIRQAPTASRSVIIPPRPPAHGRPTPSPLPAQSIRPPLPPASLRCIREDGMNPPRERQHALDAARPGLKRQRRRAPGLLQVLLPNAIRYIDVYKSIARAMLPRPA